MLTIQKFCNPLCHKSRFILIGVVFHFDAVEFHSGIRQLDMRNTFPQHFLFTISKATYCSTHAVGEHIIHRFNYFSAGTEIGTEQYLSALGRSCLPCRHIDMILFQENSGISQTELVDGLLHVTDHKAIVPSIGQRFKNRILDTIGVLVFIHHDLPESVADLPRCSSDAATVFTLEQIQHLMFQVAEIHAATSFLNLGISNFKLPHQTDQSPCCTG